MKVGAVTIENYRGINSLTLPLHPQLTVLHGANGSGKTSILTAIALALSPVSHGPGRRVELDQHMGALATPVITLADPDGRRLSRVEANTIGGGWGHTDDDGRFRLGMAAVAVKLPPHVFYDVNREVVSSLAERHVGTQVDYDQLFGWFYDRENQELRDQRERGDFGTRDLDLSYVRACICAMLRGVSEPHMDKRGGEPWRFTVTVADGDLRKTYSLEQLSGGYQSILAVAADIAWCLVRHQDLPETRADTLEAVVLIDEVDLHLHPSWQQRVLPDLARTFPNVQFVVSTHSPQVLTTVRPEHVVELAVEDGRVVAGGSPGPTYGAAAGDVLAGLMGVERRPDNEFTKLLRSYRKLIGRDLGETDEAVELRARLDELSHRDPALADADMEIRHRKLVRKRKE